MKVITKDQIIIINTLLSEIGKVRGEKMEKREKADLILEYSKGRTDTTTGLMFEEAALLISDFKRKLGQSEHRPGEQMRRHIIAMAHEMGWEKSDGKIDMKRVDNWCANFGYLNKTHHTLNQYQYSELPALVSQFKKVYYHHLKSI